MTIKNIPVGYKDSPLGIIPMEWKVKRLGEIGTFYGGGTPSKSIDEYWHGDIPWISSADLIENDIYWCNINRFITLEAIRNSSTQIIPQNSILIVTRVGVGKVAVAPCDLCVSQDYICLQNSGMNTIFLAYEIMQRMKNIVSQIQGTSIKGISINDVKKIQLPLPPLAEQEKIAEILSTWDKAIDKQTQLIEKLELRKKGLMQQLLTGKKRLPGFTGEWKKIAIKYFATEVSLKNRLNENWEVLSCTKYDGLVSSLQYFGRQVFSKDVTQYKIVPQYSFAYATNHIEEGSIGYQGVYKNALISPMYTVFKTDANLINDVFLYKLLKSHHAMYLYHAMMEGSIDRRGGLRWDNFSKIKFVVPSLQEQTAIANILSSCDEEIRLAQDKLVAMKKQKKGLMQVLLTGKKRVKI